MPMIAVWFGMKVFECVVKSRLVNCGERSRRTVQLVWFVLPLPGRSSLLDVISPQFRLSPFLEARISSNIPPRGENERAASWQHCRVVMLARPNSVSFVSQQQVSRIFRLPLSFMTRAHRQAADRPAVAICARIDVHVKRPAGARQRARPSLQAVPIPIARCTVVVMASDRVTCHLTLKRPLTFCEGG